MAEFEREKNIQIQNFFFCREIANHDEPITDLQKFVN